MKTQRNFVLALAATVSFSACADDEETSPTIPENTAAAVANYAEIVSATYAAAGASAAQLDAALEAFVADPTEANLATAKQAWLDSREPYLLTEVFRFYGGPIDDEDGPEGLLNAWPLDEAYIDYVEGNADAGIVNDTATTIDADTLLGLNEQGGDANVATGYHAIEFLLWGQDFDADGPGARPATDYATDETATAPNGDRRGLYLTTVGDLVQVHLQDMIDAWDATGTENYAAEWAQLTPEEGLKRILTGMIVLSGFETGGERLQVALDSGDQEDEHSCFSDNTHRDMVQDVQGIQNVWLGEYGTIDGVGIRDVVAAKDADLAARITTQIANSLTLAQALQPPFDQEIALDNVEGNARVEALVVSLKAQDDLLADAFRAFDLQIPVVE